MAMELKQHLKLSQQLVMTPQLQQAIKLLQLSRMELLEQVREEMDQNPLLEQPDEVQGDLSEKAPGEASLEADNLEPQPQQDAGALEKVPEVTKDEAPEIDWDAYINSYQFNEPTTPSNKGNIDSEDLPSFEANLVKKEDLHDHLTTQLGMLKLNEAERRVGALIIGNLDDDGYLKLDDYEGDPLIRLANELRVPPADLARVVDKRQQRNDYNPFTPIVVRHDVDREAYQFTLVDDRALDELPDPPGCIGAEPKSPLVIEFLNGFDQAQIALFDDIGEWKAAVHIPFADTDDQPQVRFDHLPAGVFIACHDPLTKLLLLFKGEQGGAPNFAQVMRQAGLELGNRDGFHMTIIVMPV